MLSDCVRLVVHVGLCPRVYVPMYKCGCECVVDECVVPVCFHVCCAETGGSLSLSPRLSLSHLPGPTGLPMTPQPLPPAPPAHPHTTSSIPPSASLPIDVWLIPKLRPNIPVFYIAQWEPWTPNAGIQISGIGPPLDEQKVIPATIYMRLTHIFSYIHYTSPWRFGGDNTTDSFTSLTLPLGLAGFSSGMVTAPPPQVGFFSKGG